ncbi:MAG: phosphate regulon sensor histidine kinase PhoR [Gammaproteobacteria bacterium]|nr:phosphate regulon sensor histidine kinase PhoR [Gammaproteobacteria bacterium]
MKDPALSTEVARLLALAVVGMVMGSFFSVPGLGFGLGLLFFILWHMRQLRQVRKWERLPQAPIPHNLSPFWHKWVADLSDRRHQAAQVKQELKRLQRKFEVLSVALPDAAVAVDSELRIEWFNDTAVSLLDLQPDDQGRSLVHVVRIPELVQYLQEGDFALPLDLETFAGTSHPVSVQVSKFGKHDRLITFRDLTQDIRLNRLRQEFVANVSHEIKSPLTVVTGYLETIEDHADKPPERAIIREMSRQCQRMRHLVEDLLELSRLEASELSDHDLQDVDLAHLTDEVRREAQTLTSEAQHTIEVEGEAGVTIRGRSEELHSALFNLVSNALRYSPDGGVVKIGWQRKNDRVRLSVIDQGVGIKKDQIARLTERFYRVDKARSRNTGGTGLGLAIVKHILQRHDARLQIDSEWGKGSTFTCVFPTPAEDRGGR